MTALMSLAVFVILQVIHARGLSFSPLWLVGLGVFFLALLTGKQGLQWRYTHLLGQAFTKGLFQNNAGVWLKMPYLWLSNLPYGLLLGGVFGAIGQFQTGLTAEMKRLSQGKAGKKKPDNRARALKVLEGIPSASIENGTILGVNTETLKPVCFYDTDANVHTLAIGTTGTGKTTTIANMVESAIVRGHPVLYIDGKGDMGLADAVEAFAKKSGRPFYRFSMAGESCAYNPVAFGDFSSKKDRIIELREWSEDHYRKIAEGYLQTVFKILEATHTPVDILTLAKYFRLPALYQLVRQSGKDGLSALVDRLDGKEGDIGSLQAEIENMAESSIGHLFDSSNPHTLVLEKALEENAVVYFCLQSLAFPAYANTLGKLIINDIKSITASLLAKQESKKVFAFFDEFSVFVGDQVVNLINMGRSAGAHVVLATQSLSDILRKGDPALLGQIIENCNNTIIQRQNESSHATMLAENIGTRKTFEVSAQLSEDAIGAMGNVKQVEEFIVHPNEIKWLKTGEAILINKNRAQGMPSVQRMLVRRSAIKT